MHSSVFESGIGFYREREGLTGIARKEELVHQSVGEEVDIFDRDATAFEEEGTKDNPIVILSNEPSRIVGISLPVRWITIGVFGYPEYHRFALLSDNSRMMLSVATSC